MRFQTPKYDASRIVTKFLWLPTTLDEECRWLEWAKIEQRAVVYSFLRPGLGWRDYRWR